MTSSLTTIELHPGVEGSLAEERPIAIPHGEGRHSLGEARTDGRCVACHF